MLAPFELALVPAARLASTSDFKKKFKFHSEDAVRTARDKRKFRNLLWDKFDGHNTLAPTRHWVIDYASEMAPGDILARVREKIGGEVQRVVVKPPDAAGSRGVRPIDLNAAEDAKQGTTEVADDLSHVLREMPVQAETANCDTTQLLVEERLEGEEYSVESTSSLKGEIITIAVHWKVDIDSDPMRFFERLFVTLPPESEWRLFLDRANMELLSLLQKDKDLGAGVFHAEYRVDLDKKKAYPLEVGLRPGGGMVPLSVLHSRDLDWYETAMRCALGVAPRGPRTDRVVATGLVLTDRPGILPPLGVKFANGHRRIRSEDDEPTLRAWFQHLFDQIDRREAGRKLQEVLLGQRKNGLRERVYEVCAAGSLDGREKGLKVEIRVSPIWMKPGDVVIKICLDAVECTPEDRLAAFDGEPVV